MGGHGSLPGVFHFAVGVVPDQMPAFGCFIFLVCGNPVVFQEECLRRFAGFDAVFNHVSIISLDLHDHLCNFIDLDVTKLFHPLRCILLEIDHVLHPYILSQIQILVDGHHEVIFHQEHAV